MARTDAVCAYWNVSECEGTRHCPPRCPRFVDREGVPWVVRPATSEDRDALVFKPNNRAARQLYDKLGFEIVEQHTFEHRGRRTETLQLRQSLAPADVIAYQHPSVTREQPSRRPAQ